MKVDEIIDLEDGYSYLLLLENNLNNNNYFLAVELDSKDEPTKNYIVLKEIIENDETYIQKEDDPIILSQLIQEYSLDYEEDYIEES